MSWVRIPPAPPQPTAWPADAGQPQGVPTTDDVLNHAIRFVMVQSGCDGESALRSITLRAEALGVSVERLAAVLTGGAAQLHEWGFRPD